MDSLEERPLEHSGWTDAMWAGLRALRSVVVVTTVALIVALVRDGNIHWPKFGRMLALHWPLFLAVFVGLFVWEFWNRRTRPRQIVR